MRNEDRIKSAKAPDPADGQFVLPRRTLPKNPIGVISLFVGFTEAIATGTLAILANSNSPYVGHLVCFLIAFPSAIALFFFATLWFRRESLYGPSDFESDSSFVRLVERVERFEVRQEAKDVDPRGAAAVNQAIPIIGRLAAAHEYEAAIGLGTAFLKVERYETALEVFTALRTLSDSLEMASRLTSYVAYSLIGLQNYEGALSELRRLERAESDRARRYWPALARAYVHLKLGDADAVGPWLSAAREDPDARDFATLAAKLYPEFRARLGMSERAAPVTEVTDGRSQQ